MSDGDKILVIIEPDVHPAEVVQWRADPGVGVQTEPADQVVQVAEIPDRQPGGLAGQAGEVRPRAVAVRSRHWRAARRLLRL